MSILHRRLLPYYGIFVLLTFLCKDHIFFWDTYQLCGKQAWAIYENGLLNWVLPQEIDSGHPPLFGLIHACLWKLFEPSLAVSHFAMLPFLFGIIFYFYRVGVQLIGEKESFWLLPFLLADAVFMGQSVLVSPDIVLVFFMLMTIHGILSGNKGEKCLGALGLGLISMRGMMVLAALIMHELFFKIKTSEIKSRLYSMSVYLPAILLVLGFLIFHYLKTGWFGHHEDSQWANAFRIVDLGGLVKNVAVYVWRIFDFGRVFLVLCLILFWYKIRQSPSDEKREQIVSLLSFMALVLTPVLLIHQGLLLNRYMLPIFLLMSILTWYLLMRISYTSRTRKILLSVVLCGMITGNFWVYPKKISQGWDSTLGHIPYYHLRDKMNTYMVENAISSHRVGTAFPNIGPLKYYDPTKIEHGMKEYDLENNEYIFYSNVYNDFSDDEIDILESKRWTVEKEYHFYPVCVILYKKVQ